MLAVLCKAVKAVQKLLDTSTFHSSISVIYDSQCIYNICVCVSDIRISQHESQCSLFYSRLSCTRLLRTFKHIQRRLCIYT